MRRISFFFITGSLLLLVSCEETEVPDPLTASFVYHSNSFEVGDTVFFVSESRHASEYKWNFGDGNISSHRHPFHIYDLVKTYKVILEVKSGEETVEISEYIEIKEPTILGLRVLNHGEGYPLCVVQIYETEVDLEQDRNFRMDYTDLEGRVEFHNVKPIVYYLKLVGWYSVYSKVYSFLLEAELSSPLYQNERNSLTIHLDL